MKMSSKAASRSQPHPARPQHLLPRSSPRYQHGMRASAHTVPPSSSPLAPPSSPASPLAAVQTRPDLSRLTSDPLPPLGAKSTGLLQLGPGLWCLRQQFWLGEDICVNSHIARLRSGGLMLISPPAPTEEAVALLCSLLEGG
ncbi:hypothetical protein Agub_g5366, partial [Astrephomene gubernaculifera]